MKKSNWLKDAGRYTKKNSKKINLELEKAHKQREELEREIRRKSRVNPNSMNQKIGA